MSKSGWAQSDSESEEEVEIAPVRGSVDDNVTQLAENLATASVDPQSGIRADRDDGGRPEDRDEHARKYGPGTKPQGPPYVAFVGNLPFSVDRNQLGDFFVQGGCKVADVRMEPHRDGRPKGYGYVEFEDPESLEIALTAHGCDIGGRAIKVDVQPNSDRKRQHGGRDRDRDRGGGYSNGGYQEARDRGGGRRDRDRRMRDRGSDEGDGDGGGGEAWGRGMSSRRSGDGGRGDRGERRPRKDSRNEGARGDNDAGSAKEAPKERPKIVLDPPSTKPVIAAETTEARKSSIFGDGPARDETKHAAAIKAAKDAAKAKREAAEAAKAERKVQQKAAAATATATATAAPNGGGRGGAGRGDSKGGKGGRGRDRPRALTAEEKVRTQR